MNLFKSTSAPNGKPCAGTEAAPAQPHTPVAPALRCSASTSTPVSVKLSLIENNSELPRQEAASTLMAFSRSSSTDAAALEQRYRLQLAEQIARESFLPVAEEKDVSSGRASKKQKK